MPVQGLTVGGGERVTALKDERDRFVAFSFAAADLLLELGPEGDVHVAFGAAKGLTGREAEELVGRPFLDMIVPADRELVRALLTSLEPGARLEPVGVRLVDASEPAILGGCRLPVGDGRCYITMSIARLPFAAAVAKARRDDETGLIAGEDFAEVAANCLDAARDVGQDIKLTLLQLTDIGGLRERAGGEAFEHFLGEIGGLLRGMSIGGDAAGRIEADRYGVVHEGSLSPARIEQALGAAAQKTDPAGHGIGIDTTSLELSEAGLSADDASRALVYTIKRFAEASDKGLEVRSLADGLKGLMSETVGQIAQLKDMVRERRFRIAFQPIASLKSRELHHYEVLSRFAGKQRPAEVVSFAEEVGIIHDFDLAVCQLAIEVLVDRAKLHAPVDLAVNISGRSLENSLFIAALRELLKPLGELRRRVLFEITESTQIRDLPLAARTLDTLRDEGHRVCLDDFGAGASSFPYLQALAVDFVKIDGAYVRKVLRPGRDAAIMKAIVSLCGELGIRTVAEMIETEDQAKRLKSLGVDLGQGWLFGRPELELPRPRAAKKGARPQTAPQ